MTQEHPKLFTIAQFAARHPAFSEASLRWLRFGTKGFRCHRGGQVREYSPNGFEEAFKVVGRRVLVDEAAFFEAIERLNAPEAQGRGLRHRAPK